MIEISQNLLHKFRQWFNNDEHSQNEFAYKDTITQSNLSRLSDKDLIIFFTEFKCNGGLIQSGGARTVGNFKKSILTSPDKIKTFRELILSPFSDQFKSDQWITDIQKINGFGIGTATIYLNRVAPNEYPILNDKTRNALKLFGVKLPTDNIKALQKVKKFQTKLKEQYPEYFSSLFQTDALNHYLIAVEDGKFQATVYLTDYIEMTPYPDEVDDAYTEGTKKTISINTYERDSRARKDCISKHGYSCKICGVNFRKKYDLHYDFIHVHHIKPLATEGITKTNGKTDLIPVCPNCHAVIHHNKNTRNIEDLKKLFL